MILSVEIARVAFSCGFNETEGRMTVISILSESLYVL